MALDLRKYTQGKWFNGNSLAPDERKVVTIRNARDHRFERSNETRPILEFEEIEQKLSLNNTRLLKLIELLGDDPDKWAGKRITLYQTEVNFGGKQVPSIAISPAPRQQLGDDPA